VSDVFLGVIAAAVAVMAIIQVAAIAFALKAARRVDEAVTRLERDVQPIVANLQSLAANAAHASGVAAAQAERASEMIVSLAKRVDDTAAVVQSSIVGPAREGYAIFQGVLAGLAAIRQGPPPRKRPPTTDDEDALFIG
jgi:hypothetical protein